MRILSLFSVLLLLLVASAMASDVVVLDESNFDQVVDGTKNVLVEFFAPWCGHCKALAPEYEVAATAFKNVPNVVIASVDADKHNALGSRFDVKGYPTIKYFPKGGNVKQPEDYSGGRTADAIVDFINGKAGVRGYVKKAPSAVVTLTKSTFDKVVDGSKNVLVEFYAPWCGHCKSLAPKYEELAKVYVSEEDIVIAKVDADSADGRPLGERFEVKGFPTIKFFKKGSTTPEDYSGGRDVSDFVTFLNQNTGSERLATGGLSKTAGRIAELDALVKDLVSGAKKTVAQEINSAAAGFEKAKKQAADFYHVVAAKFEKEGKDFVQKQKQRLSNLLQSSAITADKRDEFQRKQNILDAFDEQ